jgi:hypothetical protein
VLTPRATVAAIRAGYRPLVQRSPFGAGHDPAQSAV